MSKNDAEILKLDDQIVEFDQEDMDGINELLEIRRDLVENNDIENPEPFYEPVEGDPEEDPKEEPASFAPSAIIEIDESNNRFIVYYENPTSSSVRFDVERVPGRDVKNTVKSSDKETSYYALTKSSEKSVIRISLSGNLIAESSYTPPKLAQGDR